MNAEQINKTIEQKMKYILGRDRMRSSQQFVPSEMKPSYMPSSMSEHTESSGGFSMKWIIASMLLLSIIAIIVYLQLK